MTDVFTYGTLMDAEIMTRVCGEHPDSEPAAAAGYRRRRVTDEPYPAIAPDPSDSVEGLLYRNVSGDALARLDQFEGDLYRRQPIEIEGKHGHMQTAEAYVIKPEYAHLMSHDEWTMSWFQDRGKAAFVGEYRGFSNR